MDNATGRRRHIAGETLRADRRTMGFARAGGVVRVLENDSAEKSGKEGDMCPVGAFYVHLCARASRYHVAEHKPVGCGERRR